MRLPQHRLLKFLAAIAGGGALMVGLPVMAGAFSLVAPSLSIAKTCAGLTGTAALTLAVSRPNENGGSTSIAGFDVSVPCGGTTKVFMIPLPESTEAFEVGDTVTITEVAGPSVAILRASTTVTVHALVNEVTLADPAAVSIKKTCAAG